jgi:hypothetical protein
MEFANPIAIDGRQGHKRFTFSMISSLNEIPQAL